MHLLFSQSKEDRVIPPLLVDFEGGNEEFEGIIIIYYRHCMLMIDVFDCHIATVVILILLHLQILL